MAHVVGGRITGETAVVDTKRDLLVYLELGLFFSGFLSHGWFWIGTIGTSFESFRERARESFFFEREREREREWFGFGGFEFWGERERNEGRFEGIERSVMAMEYGPHRDA